MTTTTPRIATLSKKAALAAAETVNVLPQIAELNIFRTLLKHPKFAKVINDLLLMLLFDGNNLPHRLRELVIMRIGWVTGSNYEWTQHWRIAQDYGLSEDEVLAVRSWRGADCFSATDQSRFGGDRRKHSLMAASVCPRGKLAPRCWIPSKSYWSSTVRSVHGASFRNWPNRWKFSLKTALLPGRRMGWRRKAHSLKAADARYEYSTN